MFCKGDIIKELINYKYNVIDSTRVNESISQFLNWFLLISNIPDGEHPASRGFLSRRCCCFLSPRENKKRQHLKTAVKRPANRSDKIKKPLLAG